MAYIGGQTMLSKKENEIQDVYFGWNPVKAVVRAVQALPVVKAAQALPAVRVIGGGGSGGSSAISVGLGIRPSILPLRTPQAWSMPQVFSYLPSSDRRDLKVTDIEAPGFDYSEMLRLQVMSAEEQEVYLREKEKEKKEEGLQGFGEYFDSEIDRAALLRAGLLAFLFVGITALLLRK